MRAGMSAPYAPLMISLMGNCPMGYEWIKDEYDLPREAVKAEVAHRVRK